MNVFRDVPSNQPLRLLDVGCNVGAWIKHVRNRRPDARTSGIELNADAVRKAAGNCPDSLIARAVAELLPFPSESFDCVTCMEVLEHLPEASRVPAVVEMKRVLRPGGVLIMTVPHAGLFAWMDSNNVRFRFPGIYRRIVWRGLRDSSYETLKRRVEWHHHFTRAELEDILGKEGWRSVRFSYGGLFLMPLTDWLSWPLYRAGMSEHPLRNALGKLADWDYRIDFGRWSYGICVVCEKE